MITTTGSANISYIDTIKAKERKREKEKKSPNGNLQIYSLNFSINHAVVL